MRWLQGLIHAERGELTAAASYLIEAREGFLALGEMQHVAQVVPAPLERPEASSHLVVELLRPGTAGTLEDYNVELRLAQGERDLAPDVEVPTASRVYAVWYDLAPGSAELRASTKEAFLEPQPIELVAGRIERWGGELRGPPDLDM